MSIQVKYVLLILLLPFLGCSEVSKADKLQTETPVSNSAIINQSKVEIVNASEGNNLYVFVGEKLSVEEFNPKTEADEIPFDQAFKAKYKVIQNIYGDYKGNDIEFVVYDHYGSPPFAKYKNILLFVSEIDGKLYHEKYQFFDVYQTIDGRWASCGDPYRFDDYHRKEFKPAKLEFDQPLLFNLKDLKDFNDKYVKAVFKKPFFNVNEGKAECLLGAYVEDLFILKKDGVLKARGLF